MESYPGEETLVASWRALAQLSPGAHLTRTPRHVAAVFPSWAPLNNAILHYSADSAGSADVVDVAHDLALLYRAAGVAAWAMWLRSPVQDLDTPSPMASIEAMARDTTTLVMARSVTTGWPSHPAVVRTSINTASVAGDVPVPVIAEPDGVPGLDGWVYLHQGAAVAGAWSYLLGTDCGIYAVGTVPGFRRRGIGAALVRHILSDAHRRGARTASLQSTRMGEPLYASLGFTPVGRYEEWVPAEAAPPSRVGDRV